MIYRQLTWKLRFHRADMSQRLSVRPKRNPLDVHSDYLDLPPNPPTLIEFEPGDQVDVAELLKIGAIVPYAPSRGGETT